MKKEGYLKPQFTGEVKITGTEKIKYDLYQNDYDKKILKHLEEIYNNYEWCNQFPV